MKHSHPAGALISTTIVRKLAALLLEQHDTDTDDAPRFTAIAVDDAPALMSLAVFELHRHQTNAAAARGMTYGAFIGEMLAIADEVDAACPHCQSL